MTRVLAALLIGLVVGVSGTIGAWWTIATSELFLLSNWVERPFAGLRREEVYRRLGGPPTIQRDSAPDSIDHFGCWPELRWPHRRLCISFSMDSVMDRAASPSDDVATFVDLEYYLGGQDSDAIIRGRTLDSNQPGNWTVRWEAALPAADVASRLVGALELIPGKSVELAGVLLGLEGDRLLVHQETAPEVVSVDLWLLAHAPPDAKSRSPIVAFSLGDKDYKLVIERYVLVSDHLPMVPEIGGSLYLTVSD